MLKSKFENKTIILYKHFQTHTDALTTIQLASRIHRMRRRKHRFPLQSDKQLGVNNAGI